VNTTTRYKAFDPSTEIIGKSVMALTTSIVHDEIQEILAKHNLDRIDPDAWYRVQDVLDVYNDLAVQGGDPSQYFRQIGMAAGVLTLQGLPPEMKGIPLEQFLNIYSNLYQVRHQGEGDKGSVKVEKPDADTIIVRLRVPYPDDVFYGMMYAFAQQFRLEGKNFSVKYMPGVPRLEEGGEETVLLITMT